MTEQEKAQLIVMTICKIFGKEVKPHEVEDAYNKSSKEFERYYDTSR